MAPQVPDFHPRLTTLVAKGLHLSKYPKPRLQLLLHPPLRNNTRATPRSKNIRSVTGGWALTGIDRYPLFSALKISPLWKLSQKILITTSKELNPIVYSIFSFTEISKPLSRLKSSSITDPLTSIITNRISSASFHIPSKMYTYLQWCTQIDQQFQLTIPREHGMRLNILPFL